MVDDDSHNATGTARDRKALTVLKVQSPDGHETQECWKLK